MNLKFKIDDVIEDKLENSIYNYGFLTVVGTTSNSYVLKPYKVLSSNILHWGHSATEETCEKVSEMATLLYHRRAL